MVVPWEQQRAVAIRVADPEGTMVVNSSDLQPVATHTKRTHTEMSCVLTADRLAASRPTVVALNSACSFVAEQSRTKSYPTIAIQ